MEKALEVALLIGARYMQMLADGTLDEAIVRHNADVGAYILARQRGPEAIEALRVHLTNEAKDLGAKLGAVDAG